MEFPLLPLQVLAHASSTPVPSTGGTRRQSPTEGDPPAVLAPARGWLLKRSGFPATGLAPKPPHTAPAEPAKLPPDQTHTPPVYPIAETD